MGDWTLKVLLVRRFGVVDDTFKYRTAASVFLR
jgi:hypothetical protein